jgi:radical SAM superfamily enzyme YgiQ (UPF0313 family)
LIPEGSNCAFEDTLESGKVCGFQKSVTPAFLGWPPPPEQLPPVSPILTQETEFPQTALIEISRGCPWGCRFCLAGYLYRPHRCWSAKAVLAALEPFLEPGVRASGRVPNRANRAKGPLGHKPGPKIGLISPAVADHVELDAILEALQSHRAQVGFSSMRLSAITEDLAKRLSKTGLKGLAVAPEGGSDRIRNIINKNLTRSEILSASRLLAFSGVRRLKLYFMLGLPGETDEDLDSLAQLTAEIKRHTAVNRSGPLISASVANFTPKPHTSFEQAPLLTETEMRRRGEKLKESLSKIGGVELKLDPPKWTLVQGLLARGGPESASLVRALWHHKGRVGPALKQYGYTEEHRIHRPWEGPKPWGLVAPIAGTELILREKDLAQKALLSPPCPKEMNCGRCQACRKAFRVSEALQ